MNNRPNFYCKLPFSKESLDGKLGELTFQRQGILIITPGEFMIAGPRGDGLYEVMFQYDSSGGQIVTIHLSQKYVDRLTFPDAEGKPIICKDILVDGLDLNSAKQ